MSSPAPAYPSGLCGCEGCRRLVEQDAMQRAIIELENALHRAREWPGARRPEPSQADDLALPVYRRTALDVFADDA